MVHEKLESLLRVQKPEDIERFAAKKRCYKDAVIFVHHWGGNKHTCKRHIKFVNELGFDAVAFTLSNSSWSQLRSLPYTAKHRLSLRHFWAEQIRQTLDEIDSSKIMYSFSYPSASALLAITEPQRQDIRAWITDGGPFFQLRKCFTNYYRHEVELKNPALLRGAVEASRILWGRHYEEEMHKALKKLPEEFPILSIRSWQDKLVPPAAIDEFFEEVDHLLYQTLVVHDAEHIQGLKDYPDIYKPNVTEFLKNHAGLL